MNRRTNLIKKPSPLLVGLLCISAVTHAADGSATARIDQANAIYVSGNYAGALAAARKIIDGNAKSADAHTLAGLSALALGDLESADSDLKKALALSPKSSDAHNNMGLLLCKTNRDAKALDMFEAAQRLDPAHAERALFNASICATKMGDELRAENYLQAIFRGQTPYAPAYYEMAHLQYRNGHFNEASRNLTQFHQLSRPTRESLMLSILTSKADGKPDLAARYEAQLASMENGLPLQELPQGAKLTGEPLLASSARGGPDKGNLAIPANSEDSANELRSEREALARETARTKATAAQLRDAQQARGALEDQLRRTAEERQALESKIAQESAVRERLGSQMDATRVARADVDGKISDAARARAHAESQANVQRDELAALSIKLAEAILSRQSSEKLLVELDAQKRRIQEQLVSEMEQSSGVNETKTRQLSKIAELQGKIEAERSTIAQNGGVETAQKLEIERYAQQLSELTQERLKVQSAFADIRQSRLALGAKLDVAKADMVSAQAGLKDAQSANGALEQQLALAQTASARVKSPLAESTSQRQSLDGQIAQARKDTDSSKADLAKLQQDVAQRRNLLTTANDEAAALRSQIILVTADIEQTRKDIGATKIETQTLTEESKLLAINLANAQKQLSQANQQRQTATADLERIKRGNGDLVSALDAAKRQLADTQELTVQAKHELGDAQASDSALRSRLALANEQFALAQKAYDQARQGKANAEEQLKSQERQVADLRKREGELTAKRDQAVAQIAEGKAVFLAGQQSLAGLLSNTEKVDAQALAANAEAAQLEARIAQAQASLSERREALANLAQVSQANATQLASTQSLLSTTEHSLRQLEAQRARNAIKKTIIETGNSRLSARVETNKQHNLQLEQDIAKLGSSRDEIGKSLATIKTHGDELRSLMSNAKVLTEKQQALLAQSMDEKKQLVLALHQKTATADALSKTTQTLAVQRDKIQAQSSAAVEKAQQLQDQISAIQAQIAQLTATGQLRQAELMVAKAELDKQKAALSDQQIALDVAIKDLSGTRKAKAQADKSYADIAAASRAAKADKERLEQAVAKTQQHIESATTDASRNKEAALDKKGQLEALAAKLALAKDNLAQSQATLDTESVEVKNLNASVAQAIQERQSTEARLTSLSQQKAKLDRQLSQESSAEKTLSAAIGEVTQTIDGLSKSIEAAKTNQERARAQISLLENAKETTLAERTQEAHALAGTKARLAAATEDRRAQEHQVKQERAQRVEMQEQGDRLARQQAGAEKKSALAAKKEETLAVRLGAQQAITERQTSAYESAARAIPALATRPATRSLEPADTIELLNSNPPAANKLSPLLKVDRFKAGNSSSGWIFDN